MHMKPVRFVAVAKGQGKHTCRGFLRHCAVAPKQAEKRTVSGESPSGKDLPKSKGGGVTRDPELATGKPGIQETGN